MRRLKNTQADGPEKILYFAYGSNMSTTRLRERVPSCKPLGIATLPGHTLRFHKRSVDGSGKCNAFPIGDEHSVTGVLFSFVITELAALDKAEGVGNGYERATVTVIDEDQCKLEAFTYLATPDYIDDDLKPYDWYKNLVLAGGREHGASPKYMAQHIGSVEAIEDLNKTRAKKHRSALESPER